MSQVKFQRLLLSALLPLALTACQGITMPGDSEKLKATSEEFISCISIAEEFRQAVKAEGVKNASAPALPTLPMFHSNRFLDLLAQELNTESQTTDWFIQSAALSEVIRHSENQNLEQPWSDSRLNTIDRCAEIFANHGDHLVSRNQVLQQQLPIVADHYDSLPQLLGFNWFLRPIFKSRIKKLHQEEKRLFVQSQPFAEFVSYRPNQTNPENDINLGQWFNEAYDTTSLKIPLLTEARLQQLFALHRPRFTVEFEADNDLIGQPVWLDDDIAINSDRPTVYTIPSITRFGTGNLLQLSYVVWFSERKPTTWLDLYAGNIDSLIWRVTLDEQGNVLLYDSIHSCGCYHKYFVVSDEVATREPALSEEPANIFKLANINAESGVHIRLTANEHYVVGVNSEVLDNPKTYFLADYGELSNLNYQGHSKSLFAASGIINESKRLERYTLWPTGIKSVGAMRQWGTHASGFVEQQHFDDATLLDNYFLRLQPPQ